VKKFLTFYMGKNTPERQMYIVDNLRVEKELEFNEKGETTTEPEFKLAA
jgi:topoisomerase-4 subunit B